MTNQPNIMTETRSFPPATQKPRKLALWLIIVLALIILVIAGLGYTKYMQIQKMMGMKALFAPPPEAVTSAIVHTDSWPRSVRAIGSTEAVQGTTVSADLAGVVDKIHFESGAVAKKGDVLVELVMVQEKAMLESAIAQRDLAKVSLARQKDLLGKKISAQSEYDSAEATYRQASAAVDQAQATIDRKTIRAPFDGKLGIRKVNLGQYLNSGDPVVALQSLDPIYVNFNVPQQDLASIDINAPVEISTDATGDMIFKGFVTAVNSLIDPTTRNVQIQGTLKNSDGKLKPGMFTNVSVILPEPEKVLAIPASGIKYAPYGDSVFVVSDLKNEETGKPFKGVKQINVRLGTTRGDLVAVTGDIKDGTEVVTSGVFKLQNDTAVRIDNSVQPGSETSPKPEEN